MKTVYRIILVNGMTLIACAAVAYTVPTTSIRAYGIICLLTFAVMNTFFVWPRFRKPSDPEKPPAKLSMGRVLFVCAMFLLSLALLWLQRHL